MYHLAMEDNQITQNSYRTAVNDQILMAEVSVKRAIENGPTTVLLDGQSLNLQDNLTIKKIRNRRLRQFYVQQGKFLQDVEEDKQTVKKLEEMYQQEQQLHLQGIVETQEAKLKRRKSSTIEDFAMLRRDGIIAQVSFGANVCLFVIKIVASILSGSLSVIASAVDSAVDLMSGIIIWVSTRKIQHRNLYKYPRGRTRLEPLSIVIVSVVMGVASIQVILTSVQEMVGHEPKPDIGFLTLGIMLTTIIVKLTLMIICYCYKSPNTATLATDHRNDSISNTVAITCGYLGTYWGYIDPIGAILVSIYICVSWFLVGSTQSSILSGKSASPEYINRILHLCIDHHPDIQFIDTVKAYHFGTKFLVEVDVGMDETKTLKEIHDVGESLQRKIEYLPYVERAFVHIDYDFIHQPESEHKVV